jgi:mersacidin/lichenicidin family type 2 lantibiotic
MSELDIIRAWKDPEYRASLSGSELSQLPENPAGLIELPDTVLTKVVGGAGNQPQATEANMTTGCNNNCNGFTDNTYCWGSCGGTCNCTAIDDSCNTHTCVAPCMPISAGF